MRTRIAVLAAAACITTRVPDARAQYDIELRDGCPPGNMEVLPDIAYPARGDAPLYRGTELKRTGAVAELDSALVPTGFVLGGSYTHFSPSLPSQRARIWEENLQFHLNLATDLVVLDDHVSVGFTVMASHAAISPGDWSAIGPNASPSGFGNIVLAAALRGHGLTSIIEEGPPVLAALRHAWALQVLGASPPTSQDSATALRALMLEQRFPYDSYRYAPHWAAGLSAEWRMEAVGCYAPFVHMRLGGVLNRNLDGVTGHADSLMILAPQTLALGVYPVSRLAAMFQYGLLLYYSPAVPRRRDPLPGTNAVHRFRFAGETSFAGWTLNAHLDLFRGATLYDGTVFGLSIGTGPLGGGDWL